MERDSTRNNQTTNRNLDPRRETSTTHAQDTIILVMAPNITEAEMNPTMTMMTMIMILIGLHIMIIMITQMVVIDIDGNIN